MISMCMQNRSYVHFNGFKGVRVDNVYQTPEFTDTDLLK